MKPAASIAQTPRSYPIAKLVWKKTSTTHPQCFYLYPLTIEAEPSVTTTNKDNHIRNTWREFQKKKNGLRRNYQTLEKLLREYNRRYLKPRLIFREPEPIQRAGVRRSDLPSGTLTRQVSHGGNRLSLTRLNYWKFLIEAAKDPERLGVHRKTSRNNVQGHDPTSVGASEVHSAVLCLFIPASNANRNPKPR